MQRPTGVTILAVLAFVGAGILVLTGLAVFLGGALLSNMASYPQMAALAGVGGVIIGIFWLGIGAFDVVIGIGLLKLQNWARIVTIVFGGLALLSAALGLLLSLMHGFGFGFPGFFFLRLIAVAIWVWIIVYLLKPHVKQAFGTTGL
jgi:hypothetical protein